MSAVIQAQVPSSTVTATLAEWALARETDRMPGDVREAARALYLGAPDSQGLRSRSFGMRQVRRADACNRADR